MDRRTDDAKLHPMLIAAARQLCRIQSDACNVNNDDLWNLHGEMFTAEAESVFSASGVAALIAESARLRGDAERYRWLRVVTTSGDEEARDAAGCALNAANPDPQTPAEFDAAIDAARSALSDNPAQEDQRG